MAARATAAPLPSPADSSAPAPESLESKVDQVVKDVMTEYKLPGTSVAVVSGGTVVLAKGYGWADLDQKIPAGPGTLYKLESLTKQFTASAIMVLAQQGLLKPTDSVRRCLPEAPDTWSPITLKHLMTHTGGLTDDFPDYGTLASPKRQDSDRVLARRLLTGIFEQRLDPDPPGSKWKYSNDGYYVLNAIIRRAARGRTWGGFLAEEFFAPLCMCSTGLDAHRRPPGSAQGYVILHKTRIPVDGHPLIGCAGLYSNVLDLAKWDAALYASTPLTDSSKQEMWTPTLENNGYGWVIEKFNGHLLIWHNGLGDGFNTAMFRFVNDGMTIIVLTNLEILYLASNGDVIDPAVDIAAGIAEACVSGLGKQPRLHRLSIQRPRWEHKR